MSGRDPNARFRAWLTTELDALQQQSYTDTQAKQIVGLAISALAGRRDLYDLNGQLSPDQRTFRAAMENAREDFAMSELSRG